MPAEKGKITAEKVMAISLAARARTDKLIATVPPLQLSGGSSIIDLRVPELTRLYRSVVLVAGQSELILTDTVSLSFLTRSFQH